jgi:hypothetical protein
MNKRFRRMADTDVRSIIADLDRWAAGELGSKLTWAILEERSGFSRQSLQAKAEIKAAYDYAKKSLSGGLIKSREQATQENDELQNEVQRLRLEIAEYKRRENLWRERWQRIAFNIRQKGIQIHDIDQPTEENSLSERETSNILRPFDIEIPSSGRI